MAAVKAPHSGQFKPGNKFGGRKPGKSWTALIREHGEKTEGGIANKDRVIQVLYDEAIHGKQAWAVKEILDRLEGKAVARIESDVTVEAINAKVLFAGHSEPILDAETVEPNELPETTD